MKVFDRPPVRREGTSLPVACFPVMTARFGLLLGDLPSCFFAAILSLKDCYRSRLAVGNQTGGMNFP